MSGQLCPGYAVASGMCSAAGLSAGAPEAPAAYLCAGMHNQEYLQSVSAVGSLWLMTIVVKLNEHQNHSTAHGTAACFVRSAVTA